MFIPFMRKADSGFNGGAKRKLKLGIALGAGAARGWAHIGFLQELEEQKLIPDVITGTSIGAVCGGSFAAGKLDLLEHFARSLNRRRIFSLMDLSWAGGGLIGGGRLRARLDAELGDIGTDDIRIKFGAVATEIGTGHEIWLTKGKIAEIIHASYALPGLFEPVRMNGRWLMDGALVNPVPVTMCRAMGADLVIAVNLSTDSFSRGSVLSEPHETEEQPLAPETVAFSAEAIAEPKSFLSAVSDGSFTLPWPFRTSQTRVKTEKKPMAAAGPGIAAVMMDAFNIMQDRVARSRLAGDPPDILINARVGKIGLFEFHRADELIALGREAAHRSIADIRIALQERAERDF
eukprot:gene15287-biopygen9306